MVIQGDIYCASNGTSSLTVADGYARTAYNVYYASVWHVLWYVTRRVIEMWCMNALERALCVTRLKKCAHYAHHAVHRWVMFGVNKKLARAT